MEKLLLWIASSKRDLKKFPKPVQYNLGRALQTAQWGGKSNDAKPLKGFKGASMLEVVEDYDGDTYRAVYTVKFRRAVCVLHAFQKKSKTSIKTPKAVINLIEERLAYASEVYEEWCQENPEERN
ncbi:MAG TPA: type II toxin-antitoxin system RelE/ParE family toxin [Blastocatellia bacterium]|nr:type II toxin-antitoxin system RelE/ParE family toxin [Blastocatellia bacterium]